MKRKNHLYACNASHCRINRRHSENKLLIENKRLRTLITELRRQYVELEEQSTRDPLTGTYNRRHMESMLSLEQFQEKQGINPVSVVMLDMDNLKEINDTFGHASGDMALRILGEKLGQMTRPEDVVCRYGGDEFIIFLHNVNLETAYKRAEEWRQAVEQSPIPYQDRQIYTTLSAGVADYTEDRNTPARVIDAADAALYWAKSMGRNCVATADDVNQTLYSFPCDLLANRNIANVEPGFCN